MRSKEARAVGTRPARGCAGLPAAAEPMRGVRLPVRPRGGRLRGQRESLCEEHEGISPASEFPKHRALAEAAAPATEGRANRSLSRGRNAGRDRPRADVTSELNQSSLRPDQLHLRNQPHAEPPLHFFPRDLHQAPDVLGPRLAQIHEVVGVHG